MKSFGNAVECGIVHVAVCTLFERMGAAVCCHVVGCTEGYIDWDEALFDEGLHDWVWGAHDHCLLLLLLLWWAMRVTWLSWCVRVCMRHACRVYGTAEGQRIT